MKEYYVYTLSSISRSLYVGVTSNLHRRVSQHKAGQGSRFTQKYNVHRLVYAEMAGNVEAAIAREKQIKGWRRDKKLALIESINPEWRDLSEDW